MKQVWTINEAGQRPVHFYTSRKKALRMAKTLLESDGFTVEIKLNGKRVAFADGYTVQWETLPNGKAITIRFTANGFGGAMGNSEIKDCYIKSEAQ